MKFLSTFIIAFLLISIDLWSQGCAVCTKTAEGFGESAAKGLNTGILYLAAIPVIFMGSMAYLWYKRSKQ